MNDADKAIQDLVFKERIAILLTGQRCGMWSVIWRTFVVGIAFMYLLEWAGFGPAMGGHAVWIVGTLLIYVYWWQATKFRKKIFGKHY